MLVFNLKTQARKCLIIYNICNGIIISRKHVISYHLKIAKLFKEEVNNPIRENLKKQLVKKRHNLSSVAICNLFVTKNPFKKDDVQYKEFVEDLVLLIVKNRLPMHFVESLWLKCFGLHLCPRVVLLSKKQIS
jgi:DNA mismatch repair ATPase MutL